MMKDKNQIKNDYEFKSKTEDIFKLIQFNLINPLLL
jgi:hypothetical protein